MFSAATIQLMLSVYLSEEYLYPDIQYLAFKRFSSSSVCGLCVAVCFPVSSIQFPVWTNTSQRSELHMTELLHRKPLNWISFVYLTCLETSVITWTFPLHLPAWQMGFRVHLLNGQFSFIVKLPPASLAFPFIHVFSLILTTALFLSSCLLLKDCRWFRPCLENASPCWSHLPEV